MINTSASAKTVNLPITPSNKYILDGYSAIEEVLTLRARHNVLLSKDNEDVVVSQRPAMVYGPYSAGAVTRVVIGGYYWAKTSRFYYIGYNPGSGLYNLYSRELGTNTLTTTNIATVTMGSSTKKPGFAEWEYGGVFYLLVFTGNQGWYITTGDVATQIVDADFPADHIPTPVVMDGYVFLPKRNTNDIYNSDLGSVTSWTASAFISTEIDPGAIRALAKQKQHLIAFTDFGVEFFRNAGIPAPNSPLARVESYNSKD